MEGRRFETVFNLQETRGPTWVRCVSSAQFSSTPTNSGHSINRTAWTCPIRRRSTPNPCAKSARCSDTTAEELRVKWFEYVVPVWFFYSIFFSLKFKLFFSIEYFLGLSRFRDFIVMQFFCRLFSGFFTMSILSGIIFSFLFCCHLFYLSRLFFIFVIFFHLKSIMIIYSGILVPVELYIFAYIDDFWYRICLFS